MFDDDIMDTASKSKLHHLPMTSKQIILSDGLTLTNNSPEEKGRLRAYKTGKK